MSARLLHSATALIALATLSACSTEYGDGNYTDAQGDFDIEGEGNEPGSPRMPGENGERLDLPTSNTMRGEDLDLQDDRFISPRLDLRSDVSLEGEELDFDDDTIGERLDMPTDTTLEGMEINPLRERRYEMPEGGFVAFRPHDGRKPLGGTAVGSLIDLPDDPERDDLQRWASDHPRGATFHLHGWVSNLITSDETGAGLCVMALDAGDVREGGVEDVRPIARTRVRSDYSYLLQDIPLDVSKTGILLVVDECRMPAEGIAIRTGALLPGSTMDQIQPGEKLRNFEIFMIDDTARHLLQKALESVGYDGIWYTDGALIGFVYGKDGMPVDGARVQAPDGLLTYYFTQDLRFRTKGGTDADEGAMFMIPGATQGTYSTWIDGERQEHHIFGSFTDGATVTSINSL